MISFVPLRVRLRELLASRAPAPQLDRAERVMHWLALLACGFFACVLFWESFGPLTSGHFGASAAYALAGENMVRWRTFGVYAAYVAKQVPPDQFYYHHPYGISVLQAFAFAIFGHHNITPRLGAIGCSLISPPLIYAFGRRAWGVIPAAVATIYFVFIPISLAFGNLSNLEVPTIAFGLLFGWASAALWETSRARYLVLSAIGALGCCNGDWAGIVFVGLVGIFGFVRAYILPRRWYGRIDERAYARWFAYSTAMAVVTVLVYLYLFGKADKLGDLVGAYQHRSAGSDATIVDQLSQRRKLWLGVMLSPVTYWVLGAGFPVALLRLLAWRRPLEIMAVAWSLAATFQYLSFKQAADIHIFWPHYYAPAAALAAGSLTAALLAGRAGGLALLGRLTRRVRALRVSSRASGAAVAIVVGVPLLLLARVGLPELVQSRKTAGRFDQGGHFMDTDGNEAGFVEWSVKNVATEGSTIQILDPLEYGYAAEYTGNRPVVKVSSITAAKLEDPQRIALLDTRGQPVKELQNIAKQFGVQAVGRFWRVDRAQKGPSFVARRYTARQPHFFEWLFISGTDLIYDISRDEDPFATWEWKDALDLPNTVPTATPVTDPELRVAHNIAVHEGDAARAEELRKDLAGRVGLPLGVQYSGGVRLDGVHVEQGPAIVLTLFFQTSAAFKPVDTVYQLKCKVVAPPRLWNVPLDYFEKDMEPVASIRPAIWKPGYLYAHRFVALHRIGREECRGSFTTTLQPVTGDPAPVVVTLD